MGRLFWKIFLSFWLTLLLIAGGVIWGTTLYLKNSEAYLMRDMQSSFVKSQVSSLRQVISVGGAQAVLPLLDPHSRQTSARGQFYVLDEHNKELLGRMFDPDAPSIREHQAATAPTGETFRIFSSHYSNSLPPAYSLFLQAFRHSPRVYVMWFLFALLLSGMVCFWLAWSITQPIYRLRQASRALANGNLNTRVTPKLAQRRDELADLGLDFDHMAERLQKLIAHQKQLLSDVSHELRSPLARMKVALGLAQQRSPVHLQDELKRIERESNRLDDQIAQVLTLSRLDAGAMYRKEDYVDLAEFLGTIIKDCNYEAKQSGKKVILSVHATGVVEANTDLLRRALENVIRNAYHYTAEETTVMVTLDKKQEDRCALVLTVYDQGPGVPEKDIDLLFDPFVRLSSARDRSSGGYGLGLAISKRALEFHQGCIAAYNRKQGGMCFVIRLPDVSQAE